MTQFEFYKSVQFIIELLLSILIYVCYLKRRPYFWLRLIPCVLACFLFAWLLPAMENNNPFYCAFLFLCILVFTCLMSKIVFDESWLTLIFCCIAGYTTQHIAYEVYNLLMTIWGVNGDTPMGFYGNEFTSLFTNPFQLAVYVSIYALVLFLCSLLFGSRLRSTDLEKFRPSAIFVFVILILIVDILLNAIVIYLFSGTRSFLIVAGVYNILCCAIALYLQFEVAFKRSLEVTLAVERQIWRIAQEQYETSKESIERINIKCHDLKHQIHSIGRDNAVSSSVLKEIENTIRIYDSAVKTENAALDVILTEKSLICSQNGIRFTCIVDGKKLSFIKDEDIYALFGNIVDNAIEAVIGLDEQKRTISLQVKQVGTMLVVRESNYYEHKLSFENGLPKTHKEDVENHGYGMRSIKHICEQYDGNLTIEAKNGMFTLNIVFLPQTN